MPEQVAGVAELDALPAADARSLLRPVLDSGAWLDVIVAGRPFGSLDAMCRASDAAVGELTWPSVEEALAAHPRIGERAAGGDVGSAWSRQEQAGAAGAGGSTVEALRGGNAEYEQRFGHVYLVCASGRTSDELLDDLRQRLANPPAAERDVVRRELAAIARVRLAKVFAS